MKKLFVAAFLLAPAIVGAAGVCPNLSLGSRGADVTAVQKILYDSYQGFPSPTGYFGPTTQAALKQWQSEHGIEQTGTVGPKTRAAMNLSCGSTISTPTSNSSSASTPTYGSSSTTDVQALIKSLLAQVAVLQAKLAALQGQSPTTPPPPAVTTSVTNTIGNTSANSNNNTATPVITYAWTSGAWGTCTNSQQSRTVSCVSSQNASVAEQNCTAGKPALTQSCTIAVVPPSCTPLTAQSQQVACPTGQTGSITQTRSSSCAQGASAPTWSAWTNTTNTCATPPPTAQSCSLDGLTIADSASQTFYSARTVSYGSLCSAVSQSRTCQNGTFSGSTIYQYANCAPDAPASCTWNGSQVIHGASVTANLTSTVPYNQQCQTQARTCTNGVLSGTYTYASCTIGAPAACLLDGVTVNHSSSYTFYSAQTVPYGQSCPPISFSRTCSNGALSGSATYQFATCAPAAPASCTWNGQTVASGASVTAYQSSSVAYGNLCSAIAETRTCTNGTLSGSYTYPTCSVGAAVSCTFNGQTVAHGAGVTAYQAATVQYGQQCSAVAETRTCTNGTLSGSYTNASCTVAAQTYPAMPAVAQTREIDAYNVYSPAPVIFGAQPRLYFGGWQNQGEVHDNIMVADCPYGAGACSNIRRVIDSALSGFEHLNDPTIVLHPGSPAYYIMYMTGVAAGLNGMDLSSNKIYYSTSWADDGINWSTPTLLMSGFWLPSATMRNGSVELYANSTTDGRVAKFDLGASGTVVGDPAYSSFDNAASVPPFYSNVDVAWRPSINAYQMVAERVLSPAPGASSVIDYLTSSDGTSWHLQYPSIIVAAPGQYRVGTPSQWPDSAQWVYFGSTAQQDSMGFKINFAQWNAI